MSIEARYVGARTKDNWRTNNYNEINIIENGFLDEFKLAMANLQANNAAGGTRAGSFAYYGPGTGTAPLPIFLAYFNGINAAIAPATARCTRRTSSARRRTCPRLRGSIRIRTPRPPRSAARPRLRRSATTRSTRGCRPTSSSSTPT